MNKHVIGLRGHILTLGNDAITVNPGALLLFALDIASPTFQMGINAGNEQIVDGAIMPSNVEISFDGDSANITQVLVKNDVIGFVADATIKDAAGFTELKSKIALGVFGKPFDTGHLLVDTDKVAFLGLRNGTMYELVIDTDQVMAMRFEDDGIKLITKRSAFFIATNDVTAWLEGGGKKKLKMTMVLEFDSRVTTLSRSADDSVYYVSGPTQSHKIGWTGTTATILDSVPVKRRVLGQLAGNDDTLVMGTTTGTSIEIGYKRTDRSLLGFNTPVPSAK